MDAKQLLPLGIKIGKFGSYFREFATDSHEALHKIFIKNFARQNSLDKDLKDVLTQKFPSTDFLKTLTAGRK